MQHVSSGRGRFTGRMFTLTEMLVVVAIIVILLAIILPSLLSAHRTALSLSCLSNLKQIGVAGTTYLCDNDQAFPQVTGSLLDSNTGYHYVGKRGTASNCYLNVTQKPLNKYLSAEKDGIEVKVAWCPLDDSLKNSVYNNIGTSYAGAARNEHANDLDKNFLTGQNGTQVLWNIKNPATMVFVADIGAWHYAYPCPSQYWFLFHYLKRPAFNFVFVDGHAETKVLITGMGISSNKDSIDFTND